VVRGREPPGEVGGRAVGVTHLGGGLPVCLARHARGVHPQCLHQVQRHGRSGPRILLVLLLVVLIVVVIVVIVVVVVLLRGMTRGVRE